MIPKPFTVRLATAFLALLAALGAAPGAFAQADTELPVGRFYTQANGGAGPDYGFRISDEGGMGFWSEFQRLGGVTALGYPTSRRFILDGYVVQATQKVIMQWRPDPVRPQVFFVNVFDKLHDLGQDAALQNSFQVPAPVDSLVFDAGKSPDQVRTDRLNLLNADAAIAGRYNASPDPVVFNGLPTSVVTNLGPFMVLRAQRTALQHWLVDNPAAGVRRGDVSVINAGDIAKQMGIIPASAAAPETITGQVLPISVPAQPNLPAPAGAPAVATYQYTSKDVTTPPMDCSPDPLGSALPCLKEVGSLSRQFVKGRVMSAKGDHLQWIVVQANIGGTVSSQQTNGDGTFDFTIAQGCPNYAIQAQVMVLDNAGRQASDVRTVTYPGNCYISGEFHFDFVRIT